MVCTICIVLFYLPKVYFCWKTRNCDELL